jgi:hypothetical protein
VDGHTRGNSKPLQVEGGKRGDSHRFRILNVTVGDARSEGRPARCTGSRVASPTIFSLHHDDTFSNENKSVCSLLLRNSSRDHPIFYDTDYASMSFVAALWRAGVAARGLSTPTHIAPFVVSATSGGGGFGAPTVPLMQAAAASVEGGASAAAKPSGSSFTKADLVKTVAATHSISQAQSKRILDTVIGTISEVRLRYRSCNLAFVRDIVFS